LKKVSLTREKNEGHDSVVLFGLKT
jgi:hypothetical protein